MNAADWLTSDAVTEALAKIKAENEKQEPALWETCHHCQTILQTEVQQTVGLCPDCEASELESRYYE